MASSVSFFYTFCIILATMNGFVCSTRVFKVGGELGWQDLGGNSSSVYNQWASGNRFHVGDSLSFEYKNDSVLEVDKWDYYHCVTSNPIIAFNNGKSEFKLDRPGPFFFISGEPNHCKNGQRLIVEVMGVHHHRVPVSPSPSIASPPGQSYLVPSQQPSSGFLVSAAQSLPFFASFLVFFYGHIC